MDRLTASDVLALRQRLGHTQKGMAYLMGVSERTWRRWETIGPSSIASNWLNRMVEEEA